MKGIVEELETRLKMYKEAESLLQDITLMNKKYSLVRHIR